MLERLVENLRSFEHDAVGRVIVCCNRLTLMSGAALEGLLQREIRAQVQW